MVVVCDVLEKNSNRDVKQPIREFPRDKSARRSTTRSRPSGSRSVVIIVY